MWYTFDKPEVGKPMTVYRQSLSWPEDIERRETTKVRKVTHIPFSDMYVCITDSGKKYEVTYLRKARIVRAILKG